MTTKGKLLIATPTLADPSFSRTVVLVLEHNEAGAIGVVLNRPSELRVADALPAWETYTASPPVVFIGGPVSPGAAIGLARGTTTEPVDGWAPVNDHLGTVDLSRAPSELGVGIEALRVFVGYAAWTAGQLNDELAVDGWFVVDAEPGDAFAPEPSGMWTAVLRRQPGRLAVFANAPLHASVN